MTFYQSLLAVCIFGALFVALDAVILKPSSLYLTSRDSNIRFTCFDAKYNAKSIVLFTSNASLLANTTSNYLAKGVTKINATTISVTQIQKGLINTFCTINKTVSGAIADIPYVDSVKFSTSTSKVKVGQNFTATCTARVAASPNYAYSVSFLLNGTPIGQWSRLKTIWKWHLPGTAKGVIVANATQKAPAFSVGITPKTKDALGKYSCRVTLTADIRGPTIDSNQWNANGCLATFPSLFMIALAGLFAMSNIA